MERSTASNVLPERGSPLVYNIDSRCIYISLPLQVAKRELALECDYEYEARCQKRFKQLVEDDPAFPEYMRVPAVVDELSGKTVLCSEYVSGVHIDKVSTAGRCTPSPLGRGGLTLHQLVPFRDLCSPCWRRCAWHMDQHCGVLPFLDASVQYAAGQDYEPGGAQ